MYTIKSEQCFDAAHFLSGYEGKCSNIHGHRWTVEVAVGAEVLEAEGQLRGMVVDFGMLKDELKELVDYFDHTLIYEQGSLKETTIDALTEEGFLLRCVGFRPTAEQFAKYFFDAMKAKGYHPVYAQVFETPTNCARYSE